MLRNSSVKNGFRNIGGFEKSMSILFKIKK